MKKRSDVTFGLINFLVKLPSKRALTGEKLIEISESGINLCGNIQNFKKFEDFSSKISDFLFGRT